MPNKNYYFVSYVFIDKEGTDGTGMIHVTCDTEFEPYKCIEVIKELKDYIGVVITNFRPVNEHYVLLNNLNNDNIINL